MAEYTIIINDRTKLTKSLLDMARSLSKVSKYVKVFDDTREDEALGKAMEQSLKSKRVSRSSVFEALQ